jgi:hypothetical protein
MPDEKADFGAPRPRFTPLGKIDFKELDPEKIFRKRRAFKTRNLKKVVTDIDGLDDNDPDKELLKDVKSKFDDAITEYGNRDSLSNNLLDKNTLTSDLKQRLEASPNEQVGNGNQLLEELKTELRKPYRPAKED